MVEALEALFADQDVPAILPTEYSKTLFTKPFFMADVMADSSILVILPLSNMVEEQVKKISNQGHSS